MKTIKYIKVEVLYLVLIATSAGLSGYSCGTSSSGNADGGGCYPNCPIEEMVTIPAGAFQMGCNSDVDSECSDDEKPYHEVNISEFKIDKYPVTVSQYKACVRAAKCTTPTPTGTDCNYEDNSKALHPINCVFRDQAETYCKWAGKRLPSEAEWEKAARGTDGRKYPWGNESLDCDHAVWNYKTCGNSSTQPVGNKPAGASPYGAMDMIGNVWEWVADDYHGSYNGAPDDGSAWTDISENYPSNLRGGCWKNTESGRMRASTRFGELPPYSYGCNGFRCAR